MMAPNAVLCIACGYHLKQEGFLSTAVDRQPMFAEDDANAPVFMSIEPPDMNPYASPSTPNEYLEPAKTRLEVFVTDLTPLAAKRADRVVEAATAVYLNLFLAFICCIGAFVVGPLYGYYLLDWYELNRTYSELRNPTVRRSDYYGLAQDFQASKNRIWIGFIGGMVSLILVGGAMLYGVAIKTLK